MNRRDFLMSLASLTVVGACSSPRKTDPNANTTADDSVRVLYRAFSHNDYWRTRPLLDALNLGFNCVESDLWLIEGELYVAHDRPVANPLITFDRLYLQPLISRLRANGGQVYPGSYQPFYWMVDCKTSGEEMYPVLKEKLAPYQRYFCAVENGVYREGAILFFLSGSRPKETVSHETNRFVFLDGQIQDLGQGIPATIAPVVSDNYANFFSWKGEEEMPADQLERMRAIIRQTHAEGKLFRWWGAPDTESFMRLFLQEGVDLIGTDDLQTLHQVLGTEMP